MKSDNPNRAQLKTGRKSRPAFEAPRVPNLRNFGPRTVRNFRNPETSNVRNFRNPEADSGSWRIPIGPAQKCTLGGAPAGIPETSPPDSGEPIAAIRNRGKGPETPKPWNFASAKLPNPRNSRKLTQGSWRVPIAPAAKGSLGGRARRDPTNAAAGLRKSHKPNRNPPKSRRKSRRTVETPNASKLRKSESSELPKP